MMGGQHVLYVAVSALLLAGLSVPQTAAIEPGECETLSNCSSCLALAPNCSWFVCEEDPAETNCYNTTGGGAEGCHPVNLTECEAISLEDNTATMDPPTSTTVFPTTDEPPTEPPTTEPPTTEPPTTTDPPTTVPTTEIPTTTDVPTTEVPTTEVPTTEVPTTEVPTTEVPTTEVPTTEVTTTEVPTTVVPTTEAPTTVAPEPTPSPSPAPRTGGFSFGSFVGGMVFCLVIFAGAFVGLKIYRRREAMAGRYNNLWGNDSERMHLTI